MAPYQLGEKSSMAPLKSITEITFGPVLDIFHGPRGGGSGKYLRKVCRKFVPGVILYRPTNFFHKLPFFHPHFVNPPNFFRKCKFFPLEFGDLPTFLSKIHVYLFFDPLILRPVSVIDGFFRDIQFFDEFLIFGAL